MTSIVNNDDDDLLVAVTSLNSDTTANANEVSSHSNADTMNSLLQKKKTKPKKIWRCDICKILTFDNFEAACEHEKHCQGVPPPPTNTTTQIGGAPIEGSDPLRDTRKASTTVSPETKQTVSLSSSDKRPKEKNPKKQSTTHAFFAPRSSSTTTTTKRKTTGSATTSRKQATISLRPSNSVIEILDDEESSEAIKKNSAATRNPFISTLSSTTNKGRNKRRHVGNGDSTMAETVALAQTLANDIQAQTDRGQTQQVQESWKTLFATGGRPTQQLMAEQKQAEFQAKRRKLQQAEEERNRKKREQQPISLSITERQQKQRKQQSKSLLDSKKRSLIPRAPRFPSQNHVLPLDHSCSSLSPTDHIHGKNIDVPLAFQSKKKMESSIQSKGTDQLSATQQDAPPIRRLISSPRDLDTDIERERRDAVMSALEQVLALPPERDTARLENLSSSTSSSEAFKRTSMVTAMPWSERYGLASGIMGAKTQQVQSQLLDWINQWRIARQDALEQMTKRQKAFARKQLKGDGKKKKSISKRKKKGRTHDDDLWDDDDVLHSVQILQGPPASGKTALVHELARLCDCKVLEINTTMRRNGASLKHAIQESTQSCSNVFKQQEQSTGSILFGNAASIATQEDCIVDSDSDCSDAEEKAKSSLPIIIIDEVDILYESHGDTGFWNALKDVAGVSKCPIFLTCQQMIPACDVYPCIQMERPTSKECAKKLLQVCKQQDMHFCSQDGQEIMSQLSAVAELAKCDLRRLLLQLQWFSTGEISRSLTTRQGKKKSDIGQPQDSKCMCRTPTVTDVEPCQVPSDQCSWVTITGTNFSSLSSNLVVAFGKQKTAQVEITSDTSLKVLCPPCLDSHCRGSRFVDLTVTDPSTGIIISGRSTVVFDFECVEGGDSVAPLLGSQQVQLEYAVTDGLGHLEQQSKPEESAKETCGSSLDSQAQMTQGSYKVTKEQLDVQDSLDQLSRDCMIGSDATLLEDLAFGTPYLAGTCTGFGFELTTLETTQTSLSLSNEMNKRPSESSLYESGWKESCYFYGNADAFMTAPRTQRERRRYYLSMETSRGIVPTIDEHDDKDVCDDTEAAEREEFVEEGVNEEDQFLCSLEVPLLSALPSILRSQLTNGAIWSQIGDELDHTQNLKVKREDELRLLLSYLFHQVGQRVLWSMELLALEQRLTHIAATEFVPTLRWMAIIERNREILTDESGDQDAPMRRTTRQRSKASRYHYFDSISPHLKNSFFDLSSSEVGKSLASSSLRYS